MTDARPSSVGYGGCTARSAECDPSSPLEFRGCEQQGHRLAPRARHAPSRRCVAGRSNGRGTPRRSPPGRGRRSGRTTANAQSIAAHHRFWARPVGGAYRASRSARARSRAAGQGRPGSRRNGGGGIRAAPRARGKLATTRSSGVRILVPGSPRVLEPDEAGGGSTQIAARVAQDGLDAAHRGRRRRVGDEMPHQFGGQRADASRDGSARNRNASMPPSSPSGKRRPITICSPGSWMRGRNRKPAGSFFSSMDQPVRMRANAVTSACV